MIHLKTSQEIEWMREGGVILRDVVSELLPKIKPGMSTQEIDAQAEAMIRARGAEPSFQKVKGYRWTTCLPINEQTVHTPPSKRVIQKGDVLTVDIGVYHHGLHTDYATTFVVGEKGDQKTEEFLRVGRETLERAIPMISAGVRLGMISQFIEKEIKNAGYYILEELTGHGVGRELHEDPYVLNYLDRPVEKTYKVQPGLTIAVEIIYAMGTSQIQYEKGTEWSIITRDRSLSACFERSIAVTDKETTILT